MPCLIPDSLIKYIEMSKSLDEFTNNTASLYELKFLSIREVIDYVGVKNEYDFQLQSGGIDLEILFMGKCRKATVWSSFGVGKNRYKNFLKMKIHESPISTNVGFFLGDIVFLAPINKTTIEKGRVVSVYISGNSGLWKIIDYDADFQKKTNLSDVREQLLTMYNRVKTVHKIA